MNPLKRRIWHKSSPHQVMLPWTNADFMDLCTRCGACETACETQVIVKGDGGFPRVDFSQGECTFCYQCVDSCDVAGIFMPRETLPWQHVAVVNESACLPYQQITCRSCSDGCDERAITFKLQLGREARPTIDINACTGCGGCISICPTKAIEVALQ